MQTGNASHREGQKVRPPRMLMTMMDEHARHKLGMPETWHPYRYEHVDPDIVLITGMVAPLRTRGRDKGYPNFRRGDRATERRTGFSAQEHFQFQRAWELRTGNCANCMGSGKITTAAHADGARAYRECERCKGCGKAPPVVEKKPARLELGRYYVSTSETPRTTSMLAPHHNRRGRA